MNRLVINIEALHYNLKVIDRWIRANGSSWTLVTKVLCGHADTLRALHALGVTSVGDSRLSNLNQVSRCMPGAEKWYLRIPDLSRAGEVAALSDISLNSEIEVIRAINDHAARLDKIHRIIIMIELGDLREGILPGSLVNFYKKVFELPNIEVAGIGGNLGCLAGTVPTVDHLMQLVLYRELLELKFRQPLPIISAGVTATLPLLLEGQMPSAVNHSRIGEAAFLGTDLINGGTLPELRNDVMRLEAEIAEVKKKGLAPLGETTTMTPFETEACPDTSPGQRGYRALVSIGHLDTDINGITPLDTRYKIAGASSDISVVNLGENVDKLQVGERIAFRVNYSALLRLMDSKYVAKEILPPLDEIRDHISPLSEAAFGAATMLDGVASAKPA
ncbi:MAG TPA: alanine racemase [Candidatus Bathyarchaeia archaeon]|nr:alanine racemase [Candidatus Bathyarchaeia archaeon]